MIIGLLQEKLKKYPLQPWANSKDVACWFVPVSDESGFVCTLENAVENLVQNDPASLFAMRVPYDSWLDLCVAEENEQLPLKDEWFLDRIPLKESRIDPCPTCGCNELLCGWPNTCTSED